MVWPDALLPHRYSKVCVDTSKFTTAQHAVASRSRLPTLKSSGAGTKFFLNAAKRMRDANVASIEATYVYARPWPPWRVLNESLFTHMQTHACFIQVVGFCVEVAMGTESFRQHSSELETKASGGSREDERVEWSRRTDGMDIKI